MQHFLYSFTSCFSKNSIPIFSLWYRLLSGFTLIIPNCYTVYLIFAFVFNLNISTPELLKSQLSMVSTRVASEILYNWPKPEFFPQAKFFWKSMDVLPQWGNAKPEEQIQDFILPFAELLLSSSLVVSQSLSLSNNFLYPLLLLCSLVNCCTLEEALFYSTYSSTKNFYLEEDPSLLLLQKN